MYFINKGEVHVLLKNNKKGQDVIATLGEGSIFGEVALLTKLKRTSTIRSVDYTNSAFITRELVAQISLHFPHIV